MQTKKALVLHQNCVFMKDLIHLFKEKCLKTSKYDSFKELDKTLKTMKKTKCSLLVSSFKDFLILGRTFENQFINFNKYEIKNKKGFKDFKKSLEVGFKYFIITQNLTDIETCFFTDLFQNNHTKIDLSSVNYVLNIKKEEEIIKIEMTNLNFEPVLFCELEKVEEFFNQEKYKEACQIIKEKKIKNITKTNIFGEVGKVHVPKQNFKSLKLTNKRKN